MIRKFAVGELRGATRLVPENSVTCSLGLNGRNDIAADIVNFSRGGLCLKCKEWVDVCQGEKITVFLAAHESLIEHRFDAMVRWIQNHGLVCLVIGCEFSGLGVEDLSVLSKLFGLSEEFVDPITGLSWISSEAG